MVNEAESNRELNIGRSQTVTVLNPVGYPPKITQKPMAARLESLDGKKIYLVDPRFDDSGLFLRQMQDWFTEHMPSVTTKIVEMSSVYTKDDPKTWEMIQADGDGAIIGVGH
ncbi:MAG TPA: hypothetical protein VFU31_09295 [Candidatus Binatia bacterium]|nr:hypothetical protein [Candidatus Binatia bacterium]